MNESVLVLRGIVDARVALSYLLTLPNNDEGEAKERPSISDYAKAKEQVDSLISAAEAKGEAKGHAEGVAEERERISNLVCSDEDEHGDMTIGWLSLSVLTPTKEREP